MVKLMKNPNQKVVFFDGFCGLCSEFVDFVMKIDKKSLFKFSPLQSQFAEDNLPLSFTKDLSTVVIIIDGQTFTKAQGVLRLFKEVGGFWSLISILRFLPQWLLNLGYDQIAKHRYKIRPKKESCRLPTPEEREKFIL